MTIRVNAVKTPSSRRQPSVRARQINISAWVTVECVVQAGLTLDVSDLSGLFHRDTDFSNLTEDQKTELLQRLEKEGWYSDEREIYDTSYGFKLLHDSHAFDIEDVS